MRIQTYTRRLSPLQYPVLKAIANGRKLGIDELEQVNNGPLRHLYQRGFIAVDATHKNPRLALTAEGEKAFDLYNSGKMALRTHRADLTDFVAAILATAKKRGRLIQMQHRRAS